MPRDAVFAYYQHQIGDHFSTQGMRSNNRRRLERNRKFVDSPLEGDGFEVLVTPQRNSPRARHVVSAHGSTSSERHRLLPRVPAKDP